MADNIRFEGNAMQIINKMNDEFAAFLEEASGELETQTKRNMDKLIHSTGNTKQNWKHVVDEGKLEAVVGNPLQTAIWLEFGTGDYALEGKGRKGGWWIKVGNGTNEISPSDAAAYGWKKVRKDKDGNLTYVFTTGMKPKRPLHKAKESTKGKIQRMFAQTCKKIGD